MSWTAFKNVYIGLLMSKLVRNEFEWIKFAKFGVENILSFLDGKDMLMKYSLVSKTWKRL